MAITKIIGAIHPPSSGGKHKVLKNTIEYILNPEKTENGRLVGSIGCFPDNALQVMMETQHRYEWAHSRFGKSERLGYHFTVSFSPEENVAPEVALQVMKEFSEKLLGKQYEAVYSVHTDTAHIHGHLCFNSVNFATGRKFRYEDGDWAKIIQPITDEICKKYGLHTLEMDTGKSIEEYAWEQKQEERRKYFERQKSREQKELKRHGYHKDSGKDYNWNEHLRFLLDDIVLHSSSMEEFYLQLKERGFTVKQGVSEKHGEYIGLKAPGMEIHRRTYQLGKEYTLESLKKRVEMLNKPLPEYQIPEDKILVIPIRHFVKWKRKRNLSPEMKRYFTRLYRMGVRPRSARVTYQDVRDTRRKAEMMQKKLELVLEHHIGSKEVADTVAAEYQNKYYMKQEELEQVKQKHAEYDIVLKKYRWYLKMKRQSEQNLGTDLETEENLEKARVAFEKYGFNESALESYQASRKAELKAISKQCKDIKQQWELAESIAMEFDEKEEQLELDAELERFYESIPEDREVEERQRKNERRMQ